MEQNEPKQNEPEQTNDNDLPPASEALTDEEKEAFLASVRAQGRSLTSEEQYAIFGPPPEPATAPEPVEVEEMEAAPLDIESVEQLQNNFFPELPADITLAPQRLIQGILFDFDYTLARPTRPIDELMEEGARGAEAYMRATGMELPEDFYMNIIEARRFSQEKSEEEQEEHIADDAMSFLLKFFGYPASRMDPQVLKQTVDIFYAPEMTAWELMPGTIPMLQSLHEAGYKMAVLANYNCDRVFQRIIDFLGIRPYLDMCITSASVEYRKPDERLYQLALDQWDLLPYEIVVVGDSLIHDLAAGIALGALTVQVELGSPAQVLHDNAGISEEIAPDAHVDDLQKLPQRIAKWK